MDINRFTQMTQEAVLGGQRKAARNGQQQVDVEHLLAALLEQENSPAARALERTGISVESIRRRVEQELQRMPKVSGGPEPEGIPLTGRLGRVLNAADEEARRLKDDYVSVELVLLAMLEDTGPAGRILKEAGLTRDKLLAAIQEIRGNQRVTSPNPEAT